MSTDPTAAGIRGFLTAERHRQRLSQTRLGQKIGLRTYGCIYAWECGVHEPTLGNFIAWAGGLGYRVELVATEGEDG